MDKINLLEFFVGYIGIVLVLVRVEGLYTGYFGSIFYFILTVCEV